MKRIVVADECCSDCCNHPSGTCQHHEDYPTWEEQQDIVASCAPDMQPDGDFAILVDGRSAGRILKALHAAGMTDCYIS